MTTNAKRKHDTTRPEETDSTKTSLTMVRKTWRAYSRDARAHSRRSRQWVPGHPSRRRERRAAAAAGQSGTFATSSRQWITWRVGNVYLYVSGRLTVRLSVVADVALTRSAVRWPAIAIRGATREVLSRADWLARRLRANWPACRLTRQLGSPPSARCIPGVRKRFVLLSLMFFYPEKWKIDNLYEPVRLLFYWN